MPDQSKLEQNFYQRWRDLEPFNSEVATKDLARYVSLARAVPLGMSAQTIGSTAETVDGLPSDVKKMIIYSVTEDLTYTDKAGDTPSSVFGMIIPKQTIFIYDSDVDSNFQLWAAADTNVRFAFYG